MVRAILDANFPATMHQDILDATGIALASEELAETTVRPKGQRRRRTSNRVGE